MPLGVVVRGANANDGCQAGDLLHALVVVPPVPEQSGAAPEDPPEERALPTAQGDGAYGNNPTRQRAQGAGFRMQAPKRGQSRRGLGTVRSAVERSHNFFAQFGRIAHRKDRSATRYLAWVQLAACIIFIRSGFVL